LIGSAPASFTCSSVLKVPLLGLLALMPAPWRTRMASRIVSRSLWLAAARPPEPSLTGISMSNSGLTTASL
jgi:hypothetical protein